MTIVFVLMETPWVRFVPKKKLTRTPVPAHASHLLIQQWKGVDARILRPNLIMGTLDALEQRRLNDVYPVLILSGCYAFLMLISLAQLFTQRNQIASLALSCFALAMLIRTIVTSAYDFSGLPLPAPDLLRKLEIITMCTLGIFGVEFYGQLIGKRLLRLRRFFQGAGCMIAV